MSNFFGQNSFLFDRNISIYSLRRKFSVFHPRVDFMMIFETVFIYLFCRAHTWNSIWDTLRNSGTKSDESNLANKLSTNIVVAAYPKSSAVRIKSNL